VLGGAAVAPAETPLRSGSSPVVTGVPGPQIVEPRLDRATAPRGDAGRSQTAVAPPPLPAARGSGSGVGDQKPYPRKSSGAAAAHRAPLSAPRQATSLLDLARDRK